MELLSFFTHASNSWERLVELLLIGLELQRPLLGSPPPSPINGKPEESEVVVTRPTEIYDSCLFLVEGQFVSLI